MGRGYLLKSFFGKYHEDLVHVSLLPFVDGQILRQNPPVLLANTSPWKLAKTQKESSLPITILQGRAVLGGGFKYVLFSPGSLGKWCHLTSIWFKWVVQPPNSVSFREHICVTKLPNVTSKIPSYEHFCMVRAWAVTGSIRTSQEVLTKHIDRNSL